jgi:hypothetical protein
VVRTWLSATISGDHVTNNYATPPASTLSGVPRRELPEAQDNVQAAALSMRAVGHQNAVWEKNQAVAHGISRPAVQQIGWMVTLAHAVSAYLRAFFVPRHKLAVEAAALRQQLVVFKRRQARPKLHRCVLRLNETEFPWGRGARRL